MDPIPTTLFFLLTHTVCGDDRQPIFNIAYRANTIQDAKKYLEEGANALMVNVILETDGTAKNTHDGPGWLCDCAKVCSKGQYFRDYLRDLRELTFFRTGPFFEQLLVLYIYLDTRNLKDYESRRAAGEEIASQLGYFWGFDTLRVTASKYPIYVVIGIKTFDDRVIFQWIVDSFWNGIFGRRLIDRVGFAFDRMEKLDDVHRFMTEIEFVKHVWVGNGVTECFGDHFKNYWITPNDCKKNGTGMCHIVDKVYTKTTDTSEDIKFALQQGVDGIMTNYPEMVRKIVEGPLKSSKRLAVLGDRPW